ARRSPRAGQEPIRTQAAGSTNLVSRRKVLSLKTGGFQRRPRRTWMGEPSDDTARQAGQPPQAAGPRQDRTTAAQPVAPATADPAGRKSTRLNSSHVKISYA